jgi:prepilin-type N-terminal cleavage/methylation domain-containing protein
MRTPTSETEARDFAGQVGFTLVELLAVLAILPLAVDDQGDLH